jgi:hypothetical protein
VHQGGALLSASEELQPVPRASCLLCQPVATHQLAPHTVLLAHSSCTPLPEVELQRLGVQCRPHCLHLEDVTLIHADLMCSYG